LQQDVILAKQKHEAMVGKMDSVNAALGNKVYAPTFRQRLEAAPPVRVPTAIPAIDEESPVAQYDITPAPNQPLGDSIKKKLWHWPKLNFLFPKDDRQPQNKPLPYASPEKITDSEALYKVAMSDNKLTIQETLEIASTNNAQLKAAKKNVEVADAKLVEARRSLFPSVQGVLEVNGGHVPGPVQGSRFYKGRNHKLNVTQPLYYGGELTNTVKQAEENVLVAKTEYKKLRNDFIHTVRVAYYGVVKAEYNAQYQLELFEKVSELLKHLKEEREQKLLPEIDYLNVESQYYQALFQVEVSKNDVLSANVALKQTMNLEFEETVPVDLKIDFVKTRLEFNVLLARAFESNADMRIRAYALEAAKYGIEIYQSKKKPHFELRGSYGMLGEAFHDTIAFQDEKANVDLEKEWFLGIRGSMPLGASSVEYEQLKRVYGPTVLSLTGSDDWRHHMGFNLFDQFGAVTDEKTAQYAFLLAESDYQNTKNEITLRLRDDYYGVQKYLIQIDSSAAKLRYQEKQGAILEYLLSVRETTPANYVENLVERTQDKYSFIQAVADYNTALSSISVLIGDPEYFENQPLLEKLKPEEKK
jgi:outer membrane protein TolC